MIRSPTTNNAVNESVWDILNVSVWNVVWNDVDVVGIVVRTPGPHSWDVPVDRAVFGTVRDDPTHLNLKDFSFFEFLPEG